ncbi:MAG: site-specific recombinase [Burkholderiales bacterium]|nr:site-specific recombinase [Burkholderiales bacterium]
MFHRRSPDLPTLLARLDAEAPLAVRHLWLIHLCDWIRGNGVHTEEALLRVRHLIETLESDAALRARVQAWWLQLVATVDITTLLADFGFAPRAAFFSELTARLRNQLLPSSPETIDASELFALALPTEFDARWLAALDEATLQRLFAVLTDGDAHADQRWRSALLDAITYCAGQMLATGFAPELRLRMSEESRAAQPFHALLREVESLRIEVLHPLRTSDRLDACVQCLRDRLDACRIAAGSVYAHFDDNGISVGLVFRLRQLRERILRVRELLNCVLSETPATDGAKLFAHLVQIGRERRSVRALITANTSLLAAKVAERSAETGEHYISHTRSEYFAMLRKAAGGGAVMAFTTLAKFALYALALSPFWGGVAAGINYALSFVFIQLVHFTVATKQPAMTAPAMAAKLKDLDRDDSIAAFVDEVSDLVRTQVAAVFGNVLLVAPVAFALALGWSLWQGEPPISSDKARATLDALSLLGPSALFAAYTGVLLFASSIVAGWTENWFVQQRLDSALRYNPSIVAVLGGARAARWSAWLRSNISSLASNISLGFMLGMTPAIAGFFGLGLDARHVTLTTGQIGIAAATLGQDVLNDAAFWWAVAFVPINGFLNVTVSFYLAFLTAARAQGVSVGDRGRIHAAIRARLLRHPMSFLWPKRAAG